MYKLAKLTAFFLFCFSISSKAQQVFTAIPLESRSVTSLSTHFTEYSLFQINTNGIKQFSKSRNGGNINFELQLPGYVSWEFSIEENDILAKDYFLSVVSPGGTTVLPKPECMTYAGVLKDQNNSKVRLTITNDLIYGIIKSNDKEYFIEPLRYLKKQSAPDIYVVYETRNVKNDPALTCGVTEMISNQLSLKPPPSTTPESAGLNCVQNELAIASDASMFTKYGSALAVQAHNIGVINNVIWNYVNAQFNNNIEIVIVTQNVSTTSANDQLLPAYTGTNASTIISNFRAWGQALNFGVAFDNAEFWTDRNIDTDGAGGGNGVVGLAYVGTICTSSRYHILEDFTGTNPTGGGYALSVLTTHEMGHNFSASHDAAGSSYIMAPSVNNTITWSAASIASVDNHTGTRTCLAQCVVAGAPLADFFTTPEGLCTGTTIQFTDHTLRGPDSWSWTFPEGNPASSSLRNPTASFATNGLKLVSLTASNSAGSNSISKLIVVSNSPTASCANSGTGISNAGLNSFSLANINKISAGLAADGNKYMDFSCSDITMLSANTTYSATANVGTTNPSNQFNRIQFYIDYNNDGDFTDVNEPVYSSASCWIGSHTFSFTTPVTLPVTNQFLRARVIAKDCISGVNACYNVTAGQVEDYGVFFLNATVLSVELNNFDGYHSNGNNFLNWQTSLEINNDHFIIERSIDGTSFETLGKVKGADPSATINNYGFTDNIAGLTAYHRFYYRLKIIDGNGNYKYSNIVVLDTEIKNESLIIYPNPVSRGEMIHINLQNIIAKRIDIINSIGQVVYSKFAAFGTIRIKTSSFAEGHYLVRIFDGQKITTQKFMVL